MGNIDLFRMIVERGYNNNDLSVVDEVCAPDFVDHEYPVPPNPAGPHVVKDQIKAARAAMADLHVDIEAFVEDGSMVWARLRATGTDPKSGRSLAMDVIDVCRFKDGKLVEHWGVPDRFALLHQLGALPAGPS